MTRCFSHPQGRPVPACRWTPRCRRICRTPYCACRCPFCSRCFITSDSDSGGEDKTAEGEKREDSYREARPVSRETLLTWNVHVVLPQSRISLYEMQTLLALRHVITEWGCCPNEVAHHLMVAQDQFPYKVNKIFFPDQLDHPMKWGSRVELWWRSDSAVCEKWTKNVVSGEWEVETVNQNSEVSGTHMVPWECPGTGREGAEWSILQCAAFTQSVILSWHFLVSSTK